MIQDDSRSSSPSPTMNFDYLYEFSETRKVLEEFFKSGAENQDTQQLQFQVSNNIFYMILYLHNLCTAHVLVMNNMFTQN